MTKWNDQILNLFWILEKKVFSVFRDGRWSVFRDMTKWKYEICSQFYNWQKKFFECV